MNSSLKNLIYPSYNKNNDCIELDLYISSHCNILLNLMNTILINKSSF